MKKWIAVLTALVLALSVGCAALAEESAEITPKNWLLKSLTDTDWIEKDGRTSLDIGPVLDGTTEALIAATVYSPDSAFDGTEWTFYCKYNADTHNLYATSVLCVHNTYGDDGEIELAEQQYYKESDAFFEFGEDGTLTLHTADDEQIALLGFEPVSAAEPRGTDLTEEQAALVTETLKDLMGVNYEPVCVLGEADTLLCVLCDATVVYPGAEPTAVMMFIDSAEEEPSILFVQVTEDEDSEG